MTTTCGIAPTVSGQIARGYGYGVGRTSRARRLHAGMDFRAARGEVVRAPWTGVVSLVASDSERGGALNGYGNAAVVYSRDLGIYWLFAHLAARPALVEGQTVYTGQVLGLVGSTNNGKFRGMGAHLHLETATRAWPKGYGQGNLDPAVVFARIGLQVVQPPQSRPRLEQGGSCSPRPLTGLHYLADGPVPDVGEEYEPVDEDEQGTSSATPLVLLLAAAGLVAAFAIGARAERR